MRLNSFWCSHPQEHNGLWHINLSSALFCTCLVCFCFPTFPPNVLFIVCIINGGIDSTRDKGFKSPQSLPKVQPIKMLSANALVNEYEKKTNKKKSPNVYWLLSCTFSPSLCVFLINESRVLTRMEAVIKFKCEIRMCTVRLWGKTKKNISGEC